MSLKMGSISNCSYSKIEMNESKEKSNSKSTWMQIFLAFMINLTTLAPGFTLGFSGIALPAIQKEVTADQASWIASIASIVMPVGCVLAGTILDKYGRKVALYTVNVFSLVGWVVIAAASHNPDLQYGMLLTGRLLTGLAVGLGSIPATVYISEITTPKLRSTLATWSGVFISIGNFIVYILGYFLKDSWRTTAAICAVFPFVELIIIWILMPESPLWLVSKNRLNEAEKSLSRIHCVERTSSFVREQLDMLIQNKALSQRNHEENYTSESKFRARMKYLMSPSCLKPFLILMTFFFFQQSSGTMVVIFYAVNIMNEIGSAIDSYLAAIFLGLTRVVGSAVVGCICRKYGRRIPSITSGIALSLFILTLAGYLYALQTSSIDPETAVKLKWLPITLLLSYFFFSTIGFMMMPFTMIGELYPTRVRGTLGGLSTGFGYLCNFIFVKVYPNMIATMGKSGVFGFYGAMSVIGTIFVIVYLPETKGRTLQEIEDSFKQNSKKTVLEAIEPNNSRHY